MNDEERKELSRPFWEQGNNNIIEINAFHKAYDDEFTDEVKELFNSDGLLCSKSSWGIIKDLNQDMWSTKAIRRLWGLQFKNNAKTQKQLDEEAKAAAERAERERIRKEEEAKKAAEIAKKEEELTTKLRSLLDIELITKVITIFNDAGKKYQLPFIKLVNDSGYHIGNGAYYPASSSTIEKSDMTTVANNINKYYLSALSEAEHYQKEVAAAEYYKDAAWAEAAEQLKHGPAYRYDMVFQDKEGKIYHSVFYGHYEAMHDDTYSDLRKQNMPIDADLVIVVAHSDGGRNCHNETEYYYTHVSYSNKASKEAFKEADVDLTKDIEITWGEFLGWHETPKEYAVNDKEYVTIGMDKWYHCTTHHWSTF